MAAAILLFCSFEIEMKKSDARRQGARCTFFAGCLMRRLHRGLEPSAHHFSSEGGPDGEKAWRLGAKGTKEQDFAGIRAPSPRRPGAEKSPRLGAKETKEQGFAGIRAPSPRRPGAEKSLRLGAKGTEEQGFAGIRAPSPRRPGAEKSRRLGAKETKEQDFAGIRAPSPRRPSAEKAWRLGAKERKNKALWEFVHQVRADRAPASAAHPPSLRRHLKKAIKKRATSVARSWCAIRGSNPGHPD